jgi:MerR family transcriptional regulator, thiopeptide resistance regulator
MARRLGVSPKALRVYERHGLVTPARTSAGWRTYGPDQAARLHQVIVLKQLGMSLKQIADLLAGRLASLDALLELQQRVLEARRSDLDRALSLVAAARRKLARGEDLSPHDLIQLTRETTMATADKTPNPWRDVITPLAEQHYTPEQMAEMGRLKIEGYAKAGFDQESFARTWEALFAEVRILMGANDLTSPQALDLGRRWNGLLSHFPRPADPGVVQGTQKVWDALLAKPALREQLPVEEVEFARRIMRGMRERGELPALG